MIFTVDRFTFVIFNSHNKNWHSLSFVCKYFESLLLVPPTFAKLTFFSLPGHKLLPLDKKSANFLSKPAFQFDGVGDFAKVVQMEKSDTRENSIYFKAGWRILIKNLTRTKEMRWDKLKDPSAARAVSNQPLVPRFFSSNKEFLTSRLIEFLLWSVRTYLRTYIHYLSPAAWSNLIALDWFVDGLEQS